MFITSLSSIDCGLVSGLKPIEIVLWARIRRILEFVFFIQARFILV